MQNMGNSSHKPMMIKKPTSLFQFNNIDEKISFISEMYSMRVQYANSIILHINIIRKRGVGRMY